jgi:hypothetical protein
VRALATALAIGLPASDAATARTYLERIKRERAHDRLTLDIRVGAGWDSDVPQSSAVLTAGSANVVAQPDAFLLSADLDLRWRFFGRYSNGLALEYRFSQLAYLSAPLDPYSLQEHDLGFSGAWTPHRRINFELAVEGFVSFAGVQTFTPFQAGITPALRIFVVEDHDLETQARYTHVWKDSLDVFYDYLAGNRDEASLGQEWHPRALRLRLYAGYQFTSELVGRENVSAHQIPFPLVPAPSANQRYIIPYSYQGHEARVFAQADPLRDLRITLDLRYEKLFFIGNAILRDTVTLMNILSRPREDDQYTVGVVARYYLPRGFDLAGEYTLVVNRSDIDFRNPNTAYDYDDKNYVKHVVALEAAWRY